MGNFLGTYDTYTTNFKIKPVIVGVAIHNYKFYKIKSVIVRWAKPALQLQNYR